MEKILLLEGLFKITNFSLKPSYLDLMKIHVGDQQNS